MPPPQAGGGGFKPMTTNIKHMETNVLTNRTTVRQVLQDVYEQVNWAYLARNYFGKSRAWLYHKFNGVNNGKDDDFSDVDRATLKHALNDTAQRLMQAAERL